MCIFVRSHRVHASMIYACANFYSCSHFSEVSDSTKPVTAHSIQRIRALFGEKSDHQHQPQQYLHPHQMAVVVPGVIQSKPSIASSSTDQYGGSQYYSSALTAGGDRGDDLITDTHASSGGATPVAPDSIKEGWLNCKVSNIDGKVNKTFTKLIPINKTHMF